MILEAIALTLAGIHFTIPIAYYFYMKKKYFHKPWNLKIDENYKPKVTIIIPTYNEVKFIRDRLDNIYAQNYPKNLMEVIVVDSASYDGTVELVKKWASEHTDIDLKLIEENERRGKLHALLESLNYISPKSEIVVFTDADVFWEPDTLDKAVTYLSDPIIGVVTSSIKYSEKDTFENIYRNYYNVLRVAESKFYATPVHNGPFLAIKTQLLRKVGLPTFPGSDDSSFGSYLAFIGFRAIQVDNIVIKEPVRGNFYRKVRRAQHLLLNFLKTKRYAKKCGVYKYNKLFEMVWKIEWWLHVANPWFLIMCIILLIINSLYGSFTNLILIVIGLVLLILKAYRVWILQQIYLLIATIRNFWNKEITWRK